MVFSSSICQAPQFFKKVNRFYTSAQSGIVQYTVGSNEMQCFPALAQEEKEETKDESPALERSTSQYSSAGSGTIKF